MQTSTAAQSSASITVPLISPCSGLFMALGLTHEMWINLQHGDPEACVCVVSDPSGRTGRAGPAGRAHSLWGGPEEACGRQERFPVPELSDLHQTEESNCRTLRVQLQAQHQGIHTCTNIHVHPHTHKYPSRHTYTYMHTYIQTHPNIYPNTHTRRSKHTHVYPNTHTCTHIYPNTHQHISKHRPTYRYANMDTHLYTHTYWDPPVKIHTLTLIYLGKPHEPWPLASLLTWPLCSLPADGWDGSDSERGRRWTEVWSLGPTGAAVQSQHHAAGAGQGRQGGLGSRHRPPAVDARHQQHRWRRHPHHHSRASE